VAFGAVVIEKHFTLSRADGGVDSTFSLEPGEFQTLRVETERAWQGLGAVVYGGTADESKSRVFRRSLYISRDIKAGDRLTEKNLRAVRPGFGLPPGVINVVMGKRVNRDLLAGTPLAWEHIG